MSNVIAGRIKAKIAGVVRTLACDMNAAEVLFRQHGEEWQAWLVDRFIGEKVKLESGGEGRRAKPLSPFETVQVLYALLATDRFDSNLLETEETLRGQIGMADFAGVQVAIMQAVLAGFGLPGELIEAVGVAADVPREASAA